MADAVLAAATPEGSESEPVLGVGRSVTGQFWQRRGACPDTARALSRRHGLDELLATVLVGRGVGLGEADAYLAPTLRALLPDPSRFRDMDAAAERLAAAIAAGRRIALLADYDADGAASAALMQRYLRALGAEAQLYVPDRLAEGYGPNPDAVARIAESGAALLLTLDCGIAARDSLDRARQLGMEVVVVDHHAVPDELPPAAAVVDPKRDAPTGPGQELAAVGVAFLLVVATNRLLRGQSRTALPDPLAWLDLVALGTVCDVVPLSGLNRAFVRQGLKIMGRRRNPGLSRLAAAAGIEPATVLRGDHLGFTLGPRINAAGRVGRSDLAHRLLASDNPDEAAALAAQLDELNARRQRLERQVVTAARRQLDPIFARAPDTAFALAMGEDWHPGVVGIAAGRLKERYGTPAAVAARDGDRATASARSVPGVDIAQAVMAAKAAGLVDAGGGHGMAAGFSFDASASGDLNSFLEQAVTGQCPDGAVPQPVLALDGTLGLAGVTAQLAAGLEQLAPFGPGNGEPRFAIPDVRVVRAEVVGGSHVRCILTDGRASVKAMAFRAGDTAVGEALLAGGGSRRIHVAGTVKRDTWAGRDGVQLFLDDAALP